MVSCLRLGLPAVFCVALCTPACGGREQPATEENVEQALEQANMPQVDVSIDDGRVVHLNGRVDSVSERTRAEEIAAAVVGTSGRVANNLTVAGLEGRPDDEDLALTERLNGLLDADPVLKQRDVNIAVVDGVVAVNGEVRSAEEKERVGELIRSEPGVQDLANGLEIRSTP